MKPRLVMIVIALIVLPTAVLTFMANRALRGMEVLLQYQMKADAASAIQTVSKRIQARFEDDMEHVRAVVAECLARGGSNADLESAAFRLRNSRGTVKRIFLFMNPWGFVFPEEYQPVEARGGEPGHAAADMSPAGRTPVDNMPPGIQRPGSKAESLVAALRREVASAGSKTNSVGFTVDDASYWFSSLPGRNDLYAGFEVNQEEFAEELAGALTAASGGTFALVAEGPGISKTNEVIISDIFGEKTEVRNQPPEGTQELLASGRLAKPFDYVNIKTFVEDPGRIRRAAGLRYRLYAWGLFLLAAGICAGLWLVLREAAAEIGRARTRSDFVIGVSHDLRTPISSMRMLAESLFLDHVQNPDQQKKFLRVIVREAERLGQLIERVLFFVRMDQDALVYRFKETDIGKLVVVTVEAFKTRTEARDQRVEIRAFQESIGVSVEPKLPVVMADESAVSQVVLNLLDNAVKYSKEAPQRPVASEKQPAAGAVPPAVPKSVSRVPLPASAAGSQSPASVSAGPAAEKAPARPPAVSPPSIMVSVSSVEDTMRHMAFFPKKRWIKVAVQDHGIGIPRDEQKKVFRRFYRVKGTADSNVSGVGLGLALCRHVAVQHGGWIEVESEVGKGSTFSVFLPVAGKG